jgi:hypothetical protein
MLINTSDASNEEDLICVPWDQAGLSHTEINLLALPDRLQECYKNYLCLRKHLYLDRNQSRAEISKYRDVLLLHEDVPFIVMGAEFDDVKNIWWCVKAN